MSVGSVVGRTVGLAVGDAVGEELGTAVGAGVGRVVGEGVGDSDGEGVVACAGCAQILKPVATAVESEWNANVVVPDTAIEAGKAPPEELPPQYFVPPLTWR